MKLSLYFFFFVFFRQNQAALTKATIFVEFDQTNPHTCQCSISQLLTEITQYCILIGIVLVSWTVSLYFQTC